MNFELWANDLFDRDAPRSREFESDDRRAALEALWARTLREGVLDDGKESFTSFSLTGPGARWSLPVRAKNPELAALKAVATPELVARLATEHERLLNEPFSFGPYLALAERLPAEWRRVVEVLSVALGLPGPDLRLDVRRTWLRGPPDGPRLRLEPGAPFAWRVTLEGQPGVRFALAVELDLLGRWKHVLDADDSVGTKTLVDALLAAGFAITAA